MNIENTKDPELEESDDPIDLEEEEIDRETERLSQETDALIDRLIEFALENSPKDLQD